MQNSAITESDYTFCAFAKQAQVTKLTDGYDFVTLYGIEEGAFDNPEIVSLINIDTIIDTIGAEKLMNRILAIKGKNN